MITVICILRIRFWIYYFPGVVRR